MVCVFMVSLLLALCSVVPLQAKRVTSILAHHAHQPDLDSWRTTALSRQQHRLSMGNLSDICAERAANSLKGELEQSYSPSFPWTLLACSRPKTIEVAIRAPTPRAADEGCLPVEDTYDEEFDTAHFSIDKDASVQVILQRVLEDKCAIYHRPDGGHQEVWPEQCAVEYAFEYRGARKANYEEFCDRSSEVAASAMDTMIFRLEDSDDFPFTMFASATPCYEKLSGTLGLPVEQRRAGLHALASRTMDVLCQRNVAESAVQEGCIAPSSPSVETCGNAILTYLSRQTWLKQACTRTTKDFAASPLSSVTRVQDAVVNYLRRGRDSELKQIGVLQVCGGVVGGKLKDMDLILTSIAAAFRCACPELHKRLPPAAHAERPDSERASVAKRPAILREILELANYPVYEGGTLAHLSWPAHLDSRFVPGGSSWDLNQHAHGCKFPKVLRVFRFATSGHIDNSNVGDFAHVCAWGINSLQRDAPDYMRDEKYAVYVFSVNTDGCRVPYSKCNHRDCGEGVVGLGQRLKDLSTPGTRKLGCYDGPVMWYSLPGAGHGETWSRLSLDRVVKWSCVVDRVFPERARSRERSPEQVYQELDRVFFSREGCAECPDLEAPDNSSRRVCQGS